MRLSTIVAAVITCATAALGATDNSTVAHDLFIASDLSVAFTLNIANDSDDIFFSLVGPSDSSSWIAVGFGSDHMTEAVFFIAYTSSAGTNVTVSPRLPSKHSEPEYTPDIQFELLPDSGVNNETITANVKCSNCRNMIAQTGVNFDTTASSQNMIFASGPPGDIRSDSPSANLRRHASFGSFTVDIAKATGPGGVAAVPLDQTSDFGTSETSNKTDHDFSAPLHACIMVFAFLCLMPFGVVILRVFGWVRWHGIHQGFSAAVTLVGTGLGFYIGTMYNRSKKFNSGHQIFGMIIITALIGQFVLGLLHHRAHKKTQSTTKMAPVHVWIGRLVIPAGIINAFIGFPFALAPQYNYWLSGLLVAISLPLILILIWKQRRIARKAREANRLPSEAYPEVGRPVNHSNGVDIGLQHIETQPPAYNYAGHSRLTDTQGPPVEPWQRV